MNSYMRAIIKEQKDREKNKLIALKISVAIVVAIFIFICCLWYFNPGMLFILFVFFFVIQFFLMLFRSMR